MLPSFVPHVLIFPAPGQGHLNSMLKLAEVLCLSGLNHITFCNFEIIHEKLIRCTDIQSRFLSKYLRFQFKTIPDCFSFNDSRSTDPADRLREFLDATKIKSKPVLKKMLVESNPPVTYIIGDMLTGFIHDAAAEVGIPSIQFHTISACAMWIFHSVPDIIAAHQLPIKGEDDLDRVITAVPGMETILRCRDLPKKIVQVDDIRNPNLLMNRNEMREAESLILNTFEELEGPILSEIRTRYSKIYTVGPLHQLLIWGHWASYISVVGILSCTPHVLIFPSFVPHVLIFPAPGQGHLNSMLKLAEVLCLSGLNHITFCNFEIIHENLIRCTDIQSRFLSKYPGFHFKTIPDCFSLNDAKPTDPGDWIRQFLDATKVKSKPVLKKLLVESNPPVTYIIGDMLTGFIHDAAAEVGIPSIQFHTISACAMWIFHSVPDIIDAHQLPIKGEEDMDRLITAVPGMESILRCRDLPKKIVQLDDISNPNLLMNRNEMREAESLILNTFEELEGPILSKIQTRYPKIYAVGPLHELLKTKLESINKQESYSSSNSILQVDRSCIQWLDKQPWHSVLYVSFGSVTLMTRDEFMELWYGLANSKKRFLWVIRQNSLTDEDGNVLEKVPIELEVGPKERGYIVSWAPQEEVLAHKAIGGFWTHSGWNSTMESIVAGVPMICWPYFGDQQVNSRFVSEVWKLGLDMKDTCDRNIVEKMVNDLMVDRREEFMKSAAKMAELARNSVQEGGSSSCNLHSLIEEIKLMSIKGG